MLLAGVSAEPHALIVVHHLFETYAECFENIWAAARPYHPPDES